MPRTEPGRGRGIAACLALSAACLGPVACHLGGEQPEERYVAVRLHDSLSRFDSVEVLILSAGDTSTVLGRAWSGKLGDPAGIPRYRLASGENREVAVRVRAWDADGGLALDQLITRSDGRQVVVALPLPGPVRTHPSARLKSLLLTPGELTPAFDSAREDYTASVDYEQGFVAVTAVPATDTAEIRLEGALLEAGVLSEPLDLLVGENEISVRVTVGDSSRLYSIAVTRAPRVVPDDTTRPDTTRPDTARPDTARPVKGWKYRADVDVNVPGLGLDSGTGVKDFPLLVRLDRNNFNFSEAAGDGRDLRFALGGRLLDHEIARWDAAAEKAEAWVRIDTIRGDTAFAPVQMYWGNPFAAPVSSAERVFTAAAGHNAVWHLNESGRGAADEFQDATGRHHGTGAGNGTGAGVVVFKAPRRVEGVAGFGQGFQGGNQMTTIDLPRSFDPGASWTLQCWVRSEGAATGFLFYKGDDWNVNEQRFHLDAIDGSLVALKNSGSQFNPPVSLPRGIFVHLALTHAGGRTALYLDGSLRAETHAWVQGSDAAAAGFIGAEKSGGGAYPFIGTLDEMWFATRERSPAWLRMTYENQRPGGNLVVVNPPAILPGPGGQIPDIPGFAESLSP